MIVCLVRLFLLKLPPAKGGFSIGLREIISFKYALVCKAGDVMKLFVIDGHSLAHRAFHGVPTLTTTAGEYTNAVFGFTNMIFKILDSYHPDLFAVAFDMKAPTFRHREYADYKGTRKGMPDELRSQIPLIREVVTAFRIPIFEREGYEADDLIGTLSALAEKAGHHTYVVTGDRDSLQLIDEHTSVLLTRKGISEIEEYNAANMLEKTGLTPAQIPDFKGLMGDPSDNIPGVPGVGEKTAVKLLQTWGTMEEVLVHAAKADANKRVKENLVIYADQARLSKRLATIDRCIPLKIDFAALRYAGPDNEALFELFTRFEFKSLLSRVAQGKEKALSPVPGSWIAVAESDAEEAAGRLASAEVLALSPVLSGTDPMRAELVGLSVTADGENAYYFEVAKCGLNPVRRLLTSPAEKAGGDLKTLYVIGKRLGIDMAAMAFDPLLAAYLINPTRDNLSLSDLAREEFRQEIPAGPEPERAAALARVCYRLKDRLFKKLAENEQTELFCRVEMPLSRVLGDMELAGVAVDMERLRTMGEELAVRINEYTAEIYRLAGETFNINSTKQLADILFNKLGLPPLKKTKTGYSTSAEVLEELAAYHEIVARILEYRQVVKLKSTYIDGMVSLIHPETHRLHTTFNQTITATGRLSSTEPNLQNIPIRLPEGRKIRQVFVAGEGFDYLLAADYSQIELRVLAALSGDPVLIDAFRHDEDIHTRTAAEIFGVAMEDVTPALRSRAKAVNFGIVYGISDFGLARDTGVSRKEAQEFIDQYFSRYAGVKAYLDSVVAKAKEQGFVTTLLNRRRYLPDINSRNFNLRSFAERTAKNTPIQGTAADIIKVAMVQVHHELKNRGLRARMLLQVHDELIFEVPEGELAEVASLVRRVMENAVPLPVPLKVDAKVGKNWYEMTKL